MREGFHTVDELLAILTEPPRWEADEWDPPLEVILENRRQLGERRFRAYQQRAAEIDTDLWEALDEWAIEHAPTVPYISVITVAVVADLLEEEHTTLEAFLANRKGRMPRLLASSAHDEIERERTYFRLAESGFRHLYRARNLVAELDTIANQPDDTTATEIVRLYRLLNTAFLATVKADTRLRDRYGVTLWRTEEIRDALERYSTRVTQRIRQYSEVAHDVRRQVRIQQHQAVREHPAPTESSHCAVPGCTKDRVFFDEAGDGYCKRHAHARGIRPTGKIT